MKKKKERKLIISSVNKNKKHVIIILWGQSYFIELLTEFLLYVTVGILMMRSDDRKCAR